MDKPNAFVNKNWPQHSVYVWRSECEGFTPKNTAPTVKHGGGTMMLWGCFVVSGTGTLHSVDNMKNKDYLQILKLFLKSTARGLKLLDGGQWS